MATTLPNPKKRKLVSSDEELVKRRKIVFEFTGEALIDILPPELVAIIATVTQCYSIYGRFAQTCRAAHAKYTHCMWTRKLFDSIQTTYSGGRITYFRAHRKHRDGGLPADIVTDALVSPPRQSWYQYGQIYREGDLPALEWGDGSKEWYIDGRLFKVEAPGGYERWYDENVRYHRDYDLPAIVEVNGTKKWYRHGKRHRDDDKPAIEHSDGDREWYVNGERHRENDLPAYTRLDGYKTWYLHDKLHRCDDKPAIQQSNGTMVWLVAGRYYRPDIRKPTTIFADGVQLWQDYYGNRHRDGDLPAVVSEDGSKQWYCHGQLHREGGRPAVELANGTKRWYVHGKLHRLNGPAVVDANGAIRWYVDGQLCTVSFL